MSSAILPLVLPIAEMYESFEFKQMMTITGFELININHEIARAPFWD
jgi:hypothetical protein